MDLSDCKKYNGCFFDERGDLLSYWKILLVKLLYNTLVVDAVLIYLQVVAAYLKEEMVELKLESFTIFTFGMKDEEEKLKQGHLNLIQFQLLFFQFL